MWYGVHVIFSLTYIYKHAHTTMTLHKLLYMCPLQNDTSATSMRTLLLQMAEEIKSLDTKVDILLDQRKVRIVL